MKSVSKEKNQCTNNQSVNNSDVGKPALDKDKIKQTKTTARDGDSPKRKATH